MRHAPPRPATAPPPPRPATLPLPPPPGHLAPGGAIPVPSPQPLRGSLGSGTASRGLGLLAPPRLVFPTSPLPLINPEA